MPLEDRKPGGERRKSRIRFPLTLFVDGIEFDPDINFDNEVVRTSYDMELTEYDVRKLHKFLDDRIKQDKFMSVRVRFIGRLVSQ